MRAHFLRFLLSIIALVFGSLCGFIYQCIVLGVPDRSSYLPAWAFLALILAYALPVWLVTFVPLYLIFPCKTVLWRWYICSPLGAVLGFLGSLVLLGGKLSSLTSGSDMAANWIPIVVGAATFAIGGFFKFIEKCRRTK